MTPKHVFEGDVKLDVEARDREAVLKVEMTQHLEAGYRDLSPYQARRRNGQGPETATQAPL